LQYVYFPLRNAHCSCKSSEKLGFGVRVEDSVRVRVSCRSGVSTDGPIAQMHCLATHPRQTASLSSWSEPVTATGRTSASRAPRALGQLSAGDARPRRRQSALQEAPELNARTSPRETDSTATRRLSVAPPEGCCRLKTNHRSSARHPRNPTMLVTGREVKWDGPRVCQSIKIPVYLEAL